MPFELGLSFAVSKLDPNFDDATNPHIWFVFESVKRRVSKSLSDLSGVDPNIHSGTVEGVMRELNNAFARPAGDDPVTVPGMMRTYRKVSKLISGIEQRTGAKSLYEPAIFRQLCFAAAKASKLA